ALQLLLMKLGQKAFCSEKCTFVGIIALKNPLWADVQPSFSQGLQPTVVAVNRTTPGWIVEKRPADSSNTGVTKIDEMAGSGITSSPVVEDDLINLAIIHQPVDNHERNAMFLE